MFYHFTCLLALLICFAASIPVAAQDSARLPLPVQPSAEKRNNLIESIQLNKPASEAGLPPVIKLSACYNEGITLRDALEITLKYNLPIRISKENWNYQRYQLLSFLAGFVPSYSLSYGVNRTRVRPVTRAHSEVFTSELKYPVFLGGGVFYNTLAQYYRDLAWKKAYQSTISDKLLEVFQQYSDLCLQEALLQIQAKSVQLSKRFLQFDERMYSAGSSTQYNIMKSRTQYYSARDNYDQQVATRQQAGLNLAFTLNMPMSAHLLPEEQSMKVLHLTDKKLKIEQCLDLAFKNRPELRQFEFFRLAAARGVQASTASLYPQITFFTALTKADVTVAPANNGDLLNGVASGEVAAAQESEGGVVNNTALNQTANVSPGESNTGTEGATIDTSVVAGGGGTPIANTQGGSLVTSGAVAPIFGASGVTGRSNASNIDGADTAGAGVFPGTSTNFQKGMNLEWNLTNMGLANIGNILSAKCLSRQAMLQANQELQLIAKQVHTAYTQLQVLEEELDDAAYTAWAANEALRFASRRLESGTANALEVIYARRDYVAALSMQAKVITDYNNAQALLLHEMGVISVATLTQGLSSYKAPVKKHILEW